MYILPINGNNSSIEGESFMGNFNKKYIIREAENILQQCDSLYSVNKVNKNQVMKLKVLNKKLKRRLLLSRIIIVGLIISSIFF